MGMHPLLKEIESSYRRTDLPDLRSGDSVRVHTLIKEGDKERVQIFEGVVIGQHRGGSRASFTVRKVSYGVGVERIFPLHTSRIEKIEIVTRGEVRRARLNYLRELEGKAARIKGEKSTDARRPRAASAAAAAAAAAADSSHRSRLLAAGRFGRRWRRRVRRPGGVRRISRPRASRTLACASSRATGGGPKASSTSSPHDGGTCVFVEVRSRTGEERGHALEAITPRKRARVVRAARLYLDAETPAADGFRFDVVAVTFWDDGRQPDVVHIPNAFEAN